MASAEIPVDYWLRSITKFYGDIDFKNAVLNYISNRDEEYNKGITLCFAGERGRGKTMAACEILKSALLKNFTVYYTTLTDYVTAVISNNPLLRLRLKEIDFLTLDEIDQRFFPSINSMELYGNQLESLLRSRMQNKLPTILCTNSMEISQIFGGEFKKSFKSLESQFIKVLPAGGEDVRLKERKI
jgi:DNA replication protein DnaC